MSNRTEAKRSDSEFRASFGTVPDDGARLARTGREAPGRRGAPGFLQIPPFPGAKVAAFERCGTEKTEPALVVEALRRERVGGCYWGAQPDLPPSAVLTRSRKAMPAAQSQSPDFPVLLWSGDASSERGAAAIADDVDPWHVMANASALYARRDDPVCLIAAILGVAIHVVGEDGAIDRDERGPEDWLANHVLFGPVACPFTGRPLSAVDAINLCGHWRRLIDSNRGIVAGAGFAFWKKSQIAPLLWGGGEPLSLLRSSASGNVGGSVAVWRAKTSPALLAALESSGTSLVEVEDGFLRSRGLGADCIPPLSITVDRLGAFFDPGQPSELENLLQNGEFDPQLVARARALRLRIVEAGLGKYDAGQEVVERFDDDRRHILVPGQVEDDRSIQTGGMGLDTNLELLRRVRERNPDACIIYKPHPDVIAGHRKGALYDQQALLHADHIVVGGSIAGLIAMVDEVHVNTSQTGFEALLRDKPVTTYGVPFYAGWGLTTDLGPVPERRRATRSVDELAAAALLLYPRYLDPVSGLPCPAEIAVARLIDEHSPRNAMVVAARRLQGRMMRRLKGIGR